jgi:hypothetical protein
MPKKGYKKVIVAVARKLLRIIWHLLVNDELFVDDAPRSKQVILPKLPKSVQKFGFDKFFDLLSRVSEVILRDSNDDILRLRVGT